MGRKKGLPEIEESAPDGFDPENPYKDLVVMVEMREHIVREKKAKILREKVKWCYRVEGVNHYQKFRHHVQQYLDSTRGIGWGKDHRPISLHVLTLLFAPYIFFFMNWLGDMLLGDLVMRRLFRPATEDSLLGNAFLFLLFSDMDVEVRLNHPARDYVNRFKFRWLFGYTY